jgi:RNA polymerase sigma factor (sigma-70 family)
VASELVTDEQSRTGGSGRHRTGALRVSTSLRLTRLVAEAIDGDRGAWDALVSELQNVTWRTIMAVGLNEHDAKDAFAATFFKLFEHLGDIRDPERLPGWMATTARREAYAIIRSRKRMSPHDLMGHEPPTDSNAGVDEHLLDGELRRAAVEAFRRLAPRERELLAFLMTDPPPSYAEVSEQLGMPIGSIGPTRQRCLEKLRKTPEILQFIESRGDHAR